MADALGGEVSGEVASVTAVKAILELDIEKRVMLYSKPSKRICVRMANRIPISMGWQPPSQQLASMVISPWL